MAKRRVGIENRTKAMEKMVELASEATRLQTMLAERDEAIAAVNERFAERIDTASKVCLCLKNDLKVWAKNNEREADGDSRTIRFAGVGEIQLRTGNPEVRLARGVSEEDAIRRLYDQGQGGYVRTVQELNREAILADRQDETRLELLETCGLVVRQGESVLFSIEGVGRV
jgi:phage host-nuclease inhibitor protein Gam